MRAFLSLTCGGPARVATSAAALVAIAFLLSGSGWELLRAAWFTLLALAGFTFAFAILAMVGAATGVDEGASTKPTEEA